MGSYQNPVKGAPDPYEGYRPEAIGKRHSDNGEPPKEEPPDNEGLLAQALKAIQKGIDAFLEHFGSKLTQYFEPAKNLRAFKTALEVLKMEDRSQDVDFLNDLANYWNQAIAESVEYKNHKAAPIFNIFAKKILHYPANQTHTFGYYLTEHAGQKWIPFPYMELIQKIHQEHEKNPASSALTEWVRLLNDTIDLLQESL